VLSHWKREGGAFELAVTVPIGSTATVYVPAKDRQSVTEGDGPAEKAQGVVFLRMDSGRAVYTVQSGAYRFASK
jgi:alpha-L-rhamnosidase